MVTNSSIASHGGPSRDQIYAQMFRDGANAWISVSRNDLRRVARAHDTDIQALLDAIWPADTQAPRADLPRMTLSAVFLPYQAQTSDGIRNPMDDFLLMAHEGGFAVLGLPFESAGDPTIAIRSPVRSLMPLNTDAFEHGLANREVSLKFGPRQPVVPGWIEAIEEVEEFEDPSGFFGDATPRTLICLKGIGGAGEEACAVPVEQAGLVVQAFGPPSPEARVRIDSTAGPSGPS